MSRWRRPPTEEVDVLMVCTGNMCRSPIMHTVLAAEVPELTVRSAGTSAPANTAWHPLAMEVLTEAGLEGAGQAQRLRRPDAIAAKLVLTAEGIHRAAVVTFDPTAEDRCFTLLEAARLARISPPAAGIGAEGLAAHLATTLKEHPLEMDDDLPDPIAGEIEDFRVCRARIENALLALLPALRGPDV
jgi:protein-tyrosine phosphatase